ncbi:hypothetical protein PQO03_11505 [Lentisphaera profundi]|uniref:AMIN domain-containing protein n=1 Tax=Lentisphaera profundi TaxID=1658616 RepID=A0ABY7VQ68_9BACT|nr:hypothetical protein [Lentisphaera profundi]WDE96335.1 hypothetical protein PQO03_11505 [Lentisphaera profundi]
MATKVEKNKIYYSHQNFKSPSIIIDLNTLKVSDIKNIDITNTITPNSTLDIEPRFTRFTHTINGETCTLIFEKDIKDNTSSSTKWVRNTLKVPAIIIDVITFPIVIFFVSEDAFH